MYKYLGVIHKLSKIKVYLNLMVGNDPILVLLFDFSILNSTLIFFSGKNDIVKLLNGFLLEIGII